MTVRTRRVRDQPTGTEGCRVLVDRLWPRGIRKDDLPHDLWFKEVAPSDELRRWYGHDPEKYDEFVRRYRDELDDSGALDELRDIVREHAVVTLLYDSKDRDRNQAVVLVRLLGGDDGSS